MIKVKGDGNENQSDCELELSVTTTVDESTTLSPKTLPSLDHKVSAVSTDVSSTKGEYGTIESSEQERLASSEYQILNVKWKCPNCPNVNLASFQHCANCDEPRPAENVYSNFLAPAKSNVVDGASAQALERVEDYSTIPAAALDTTNYTSMPEYPDASDSDAGGKPHVSIPAVVTRKDSNYADILSNVGKEEPDIKNP